MAKPQRAFWQRNRPVVITVLLILCTVVVFFAPRIIILVEAGEAGVKFRRFLGGVVLTRVYGEGIHLIFPWDSMTVYNVRIREHPISFDVLTENGLSVHLNVSVRYHPNYDTLPTLHQRLGPDYEEKVVYPLVTAAVRSVVGKYRADELYASTKPVEREVNRTVGADLGSYFVGLDSVVIETITLPPYIRQSIEYKEQQRELLEAYQYIIRLEQQEAARKEIEAFGWSNFNTVVGRSLSQNLLQWRGIEATTTLAKSPNSKVVVIGNSQGSLPVILGSDYTSAPPANEAVAAEPEMVIPRTSLDDRLQSLRENLAVLYRRSQPNPNSSPPDLLLPPGILSDTEEPGRSDGRAPAPAPPSRAPQPEPTQVPAAPVIPEELTSPSAP